MIDLFAPGVNSSWKGILKLRYMSFLLVSIMIFLVKIIRRRFQSSDSTKNIKVKCSFTSEQQDPLHVPVQWAVCQSHLMLPVNAQLSVAPPWSWLLWLFLAGRNPHAFIQSASGGWKCVKSLEVQLCFKLSNHTSAAKCPSFF